MRSKRRKKKKACAALSSAVAGAHHLSVVQSTTSLIANAASSVNLRIRTKKSGRYLRHGALPNKKQSVWGRIEDTAHRCDEMEFFMFVGLSRASFEMLVEICTNVINRIPLFRDCGVPEEKHLKRRLYGPRGIMAMTIKYLSSTAEAKDLYPQFGAPSMVFRRSVELGMVAIVSNMSHEKMRIIWDRSQEGLAKMADRTKMFLDIPGVVGMIDGRKMSSLHPEKFLDQNRDYNGWTKEVNRNVVLLWDPCGMIVDAVVNTPGNFHDSKSTLWGNVYDHISTLPDGFKVVCDSAFETRGFLSGKLVKLKNADGGFAETSYDKSLTHLRQSSEWGNGVLCNAWRRLRMPLPTNNTNRGLLLWSCILMHNFRTLTCDRNQIKTYFDNLDNI